jgi:putative ABC transport system permease protein
VVFRSTRILLKHWKLTAIAVFSLSIAMALGVISLSVSNTFLLLPPAAAEPDRLVVARTKGDPRLWIEPLNQAVQGLGIVLPFRPVTFDTWTNFPLLAERITAGCVAGLSALGMLLAVVGLFGAISYSVSERKKELGIRVALGARPGQLLEMVLRQTLLITGVGTAIGILLGVGATVLLRSQFYGVSAVEWTVLVPVTFAMLAVSAVVAYICARSWITIDPMEAVRHA